MKTVMPNIHVLKMYQKNYKKCKKNKKCSYVFLYSVIMVLPIWTPNDCEIGHISCLYRACTGPMLAASAQYRPGTGNSALKQFTLNQYPLSTHLTKCIQRMSNANDTSPVV